MKNATKITIIDTIATEYIIPDWDIDCSSEPEQLVSERHIERRKLIDRQVEETERIEHTFIVEENQLDNESLFRLIMDSIINGHKEQALEYAKYYGNYGIPEFFSHALNSVSIDNYHQTILISLLIFWLQQQFNKEF